jgi:hypothetical protein
VKIDFNSPNSSGLPTAKNDIFLLTKKSDHRSSFFGVQKSSFWRGQLTDSWKKLLRKSKSQEFN